MLHDPLKEYVGNMKKYLQNMKKYVKNMKEYIGNMKKYVENMKEYEEICRCNYWISHRPHIGGRTWKNSELSPSIWTLGLQKSPCPSFLLGSGIWKNSELSST